MYEKNNMNNLKFKGFYLENIFKTYNITLVSHKLTIVQMKEGDAWFSVGHFPALDLSFQL